jgi:hypothetical protein
MIHIRATIAIRIGVLVSVISTMQGSVAMGQHAGDTLYHKSGLTIRVVDSSYHLTGPAVIRFGPNPNFIDYKRVVIQGTKTERGCSYHSYGLGQFPSERVVEDDELLCVQIRSRGAFRDLPEAPLGRGRIAPFRVNFDSIQRRVNSPPKDTAGRKP